MQTLGTYTDKPFWMYLALLVFAINLGIWIFVLEAIAPELLEQSSFTTSVAVTLGLAVLLGLMYPILKIQHYLMMAGAAILGGFTQWAIHDSLAVWIAIITFGWSSIAVFASIRYRPRPMRTEPAD